MSHPVLVIGHHNDPWWVNEAQKLLNATQPTGMMLGYHDLSENGVFDETMEEDVKLFQTRFGLHPDGKIGPDTWAALVAEAAKVAHAQQAAYDAQDKIDEAHERKVKGMARAPGHHEPEHEDPPPTRAQIDRGRVVVDHHIDDIVPRAHDFAEEVHKMGPPHEVLPKLVHAAATGIELAEHTLPFAVHHALGVIGQRVLLGGGALAAVVVPFTMWLEAIEANFAGELKSLRWEVYRPWLEGYLAGLYGHGPAQVAQLFTPIRDYGYHASSALSAEDKKGVLALLVFASGSMGFVDEPDQLTPAQWASSKENRGWTRQGLERVIIGHDR